MKTRDLFFLVVLVVVVYMAMSPAPAPAPRNPHPVRAFVMKVARAVGVWWLLSGDAPTSPAFQELYQEQPRELVNALPSRELGDDGHPQLANGAGW